MAQFDVHRNKGALREAIPFVVLVQSAQFDGYRRRVVVPLVRRSMLPSHTVACWPGLPRHLNLTCLCPPSRWVKFSAALS